MVAIIADFQHIGAQLIGELGEEVWRLKAH